KLRREAQDRAQKAEQAATLERRLRAEQVVPGTIVVHSRPDEAAVWLLLGRTPFDSIALSTENVWELRVELEGYAAQDVRVGGAAADGRAGGDPQLPLAAAPKKDTIERAVDLVARPPSGR